MALLVTRDGARGRRRHTPAARRSPCISCARRRSARSPRSATVERAGRSMTTVTARLEQDGKPVALGVGAFAGAYGGPDVGERPMPDVAPPGDAAPPLPGRATRDRTPRAAAALRRRALHRLRGPAGRRLDRPARRATDRRAGPVRAGRRLVPRDLAPAQRVQPGADDRSDAPRARAAAGQRPAARPLHEPARAATATSRRTASCGRRTARSSRSRGNSRCCCELSAAELAY